MLHFLGIGAQKAGTTWLYQLLSKHPQVRFPANKEVHFWDRRDLDALPWYQGLFDASDGSDIRNGEITPSYAMLGRKRIEAIHTLFPALRLLYLIRNPIDRAWSASLMAVSRAEMTVDEASDSWFADHFRSQGSLGRGDYLSCIRSWTSIYPRDQLLIERYESIQNEPRELLRRVAAHLGIDAGFFDELPDAALERRVFPGSGHPLRPSLRPLLEQLYRKKIRALNEYLELDLYRTPPRGQETNGRGGRQGDSGGAQNEPALATKQARPTAILVLGMHRSGTSALTRVISLLGATLPSNLMPPVKDNNEAGFWESLDAYRLNDDILASAGSSWDHWGELNPGWTHAPAIGAFKARARAMLEHDFAGSPLFVLKDPRLCRLLPFWLEVLLELGADVKCVLPLRNPLEVAASLKARDGFSVAKSHVLWLRHVLDAESGSRGLPRVFISYDGLLADWRALVQRMSVELGIAWPRSLATSEVEVDSFLQGRHRHHAADTAELLEHPAIDPWVKKAFTALEALQAQPESEAALARLDSVRTDLDRACEALGPVLRAEELAHANAKRARKVAEERLAEYASRAADLSSTVSANERRINELERTLAERDRRIASIQTELERTLAERDRRIASIETDLAGERRRVEEARDERNQLVYRLNEIQTSATWQLAIPMRSLEGRFPGAVRKLAAVPKLACWSVSLRLPERLRLGRQADELLASGLFDLPWYMERNSDVIRDGANPVLHWMVTGYRQGRDPNPLFDTAWYLSQNPDVDAAGINPLVHYSTLGASAGRDPHPLFDSSWYLEENPDVREAGTNPLAHFLLVGAAEGRDPNPLFETSRYVEAQGGACSPKDALTHFAASGESVAVGAYRSQEVLLSVQRDYYAKTDMRLLRDQRAGGKRYAVYLQCGSGSIHSRWLPDSAQSWDLIVNHYDPTFVGRIPCQVEFQQTGELPGTKFTSFHTLLQRWPEIVDGYDYVLLLDDDIAFEAADVAALFALAADEGLELAQASLSRDSHACHGIFRTREGGRLRYVNGVEIMMPMISRAALTETRNVFGETVSGWGLDVALAKMVKERLNGRAAVADSIVARHTKRIDLKDGAFYRMLAQANIFPLLEYRHLRQVYSADAGFYEI